MVQLGVKILSLQQAKRESYLPNFDDLQYSRERRKAIDAALLKIPPREAIVIRRRFGLDGEDRATLAEVGKALGVSAQRVREIEYKALRHLRRR